MKNAILLLGTIFISSLAIAQDVLGKWTTIDDKTGKHKSTVELYKENNKLYGKITYLYPREGREPNPTCKKCSDDRKGQPLEGLQIVRNLSQKGDEWKGGTIVDPETGKVYDVKIWLDSKDKNTLNVRGYVGPFYRTQTWKRVQ